MAKVTLSVPDDLYAKIEKHKDQINYSDVFRTAVSGEIEKLEGKSEIIDKLHEYLRSKMPLPDKEATRKLEIERFKQKWGEPDIAHPDDSPGANPPYIYMEKRFEIRYGDIYANLRVFNGVRTYWIEYSPREYKPENWISGILLGRGDQIADYFKSVGLTIVETPLDQDGIMTFVTGGNKEQAIELRGSGYDHYGLFAHDKEDTVFIGCRQVKIVWPTK